MAIDPGLLAGKEEFMSRVTELTTNIKSAKPFDGQSVSLPGELGDAKVQAAEASGEIES